ncbi:helix-turn-helix domain-containing protein [Sinosporangium album]|nr:helix-turn-helix transcriptional regulator [Sinosporangium album]
MEELKVDLNGVNRRIASWRERRNLTQEEFGTHMGRSRSWVQKLESGHRQLDPRISVLEQACKVLDIPLEALLSDQSSDNAEKCVDAAEVVVIKEAFHRYDVISGNYSEATAPVDINLLKRQAAYGWDAFQAAHYSAIGRLLPALIVNAGSAVQATDGTNRLAALRHAALVYQLACAVLVKFSDAATASIAAHHAVTSAERSGDPITIAASIRQLVHAFLAGQQVESAIEIAVAAQGRLYSALLQEGEAGISVYGMLLLKAAVAAADADDAPLATELIDESSSLATQLGRDSNIMWTGYGPTNCLLHRVSTHVQLQDGEAALSAAQAIDPGAFDSLPRERRAAHTIDLAHSHALVGKTDQALTALLAGERLAPQEVHCRPHAHKVITRLLRAPGTVSPRLRALATRAGAAA